MIRNRHKNGGRWCRERLRSLFIGSARTARNAVRIDVCHWTQPRSRDPLHRFLATDATTTTTTATAQRAAQNNTAALSRMGYGGMAHWRVSNTHSHSHTHRHKT